MRRRYALVLAVVVYVSLDLTLPAMPGVFMFESADSVEHARVAGGRARVVEAVLPLPLTGDSLDPSRWHPDLTGRLALVPLPPPFRRHRVTNGLSRAHADPASPSEDPH